MTTDKITYGESKGIRNFKVIQKGEILYLYGTTSLYYYKQMAEYWTAKRSGMKI